MSTPKTAKDSAISSEIEDIEIQDTFRKTAQIFGLSDFSTEEALHELLQEKTADTLETRFMSHIRKELFKEAKLLGEACPYSAKELTEITKSAEAFQKAAMLEAQSFWLGLAESLVKEGKDRDFLKGILKQAEEFSEAVGASPGLADMGKNLINTLREGAGKAVSQIREKAPDLKELANKGSADVGTALKEIGESASTGASEMGEAASNLGNLAKQTGSEIATTLGDTAGKAKEQIAPIVKTLGQKAQEATDKGRDVLKNLTSSLTPEDDRHQIIPGMGNSYLGAAGGALLSALLGSQLGLSGPASWLVPLLGGAAGYHYLPKLMNMWKDAPGTGVNTVPEGTQKLNQKYPILGAPAPFVGNPPPFTGPSSPAQGATMSPGNLLGMSNARVI